MAKFNLDSTDPRIDIKALEASTWAGAVSKVLGFFKSREGLVRVNVDKHGNADFWEEQSDVHISLDADSGNGFELWEVPTTDLWDAPTPGSGAAQVQAANPDDLARAQERLGDINNAETELSACQIALDLLMELVPAESGSILLAEGSALRFVSVRGPKSEALVGKTIGIDRGIAGACAQAGTPLLVRQARGNIQHDSSIDASVDYLTKTLLALPMSNGEHIVGVIELLNPFGMDTFTADQQRLAKEIGAHLAGRFKPTC